MAKKNGKNKKNTARMEWRAAWLAVRSTVTAPMFRVILGGVLLLATGVGVMVGLGRLEQTVQAQERFSRELALEWVNLPDWLKVRDNRHILENLARRVNLRVEDRMLDPDLARRLGETLLGPEVGWVKSVERVIVRPDGVVTISCAFRRPTAWIAHGKYCYLIDEAGVRLPGRYEVASCEGAALMIVDGVKMTPPEVGAVWRGTDLAAGLKLATKLADKSYRHQIRHILVENYDGRQDRSRPHIELVTDRPGSRVWWGRAIGEELGMEITAQQKLVLLQALYDQMGRIDMDKPYVNIMTSPNYISLPETSSTEKGSRSQRG